MSEYITTSFGDRVAYDRHGSGPALIFVAGALPFRAMDPATTETAEKAAAIGLTTTVYDRVGRGESQAEGEIHLDRELAAIAALIDVNGGSAALCGHSSGSTIALAAAASGLSVTALALWETPLDPTPGETGPWVAEVERRLQAGDLEGALRHYVKDIPPEILDFIFNSPLFDVMVAQAGSLRADGESLVWADSAPLDELFARIRVPVAAYVGEQTLPLMETAAAKIGAAIPGATIRKVPGSNHNWDVDAMAEDLVHFVWSATQVLH
jgi:pimeloyl-ACP methyl ester carboxylesterase